MSAGTGDMAGLLANDIHVAAVCADIDGGTIDFNNGKGITIEVRVIVKDAVCGDVENSIVLPEEVRQTLTPGHYFWSLESGNGVRYGPFRFEIAPTN